MKDKLNEAKEKIGAEGALIKLFQKFREDLPKLTAKEQIARIGEMLFVATVGKFIGLQKILKKKEKEPKKAKKSVTKPKIESSDKNEEEPKTETEATEDKKTAIEKLAEIPNINKRVVKVAEQMVKEETDGLHCWDWCDKVYKAAKVKRGAKGYYSSHTKYKGKDCGGNCANNEQLDAIEPGAHIFVNNQNDSDTHGNHSVIFLRWINKEKRLAKVAGLPWPGRPPQEATYDLSPVKEKDPSRKRTGRYPVVAISNPA